MLPLWLPILGVIAVGVAGLWLFSDDNLINGWPDAIFVFAWGATNAGIGASIARLIKRFIASILARRRA